MLLLLLLSCYYCYCHCCCCLRVIFGVVSHTPPRCLVRPSFCLCPVWIYFARLLCLPISGGYSQEMSVCLRRPGLFWFVRSVCLYFVFLYGMSVIHWFRSLCRSLTTQMYADVRIPYVGYAIGPRTFNFGICVQLRPRPRWER